MPEFDSTIEYRDIQGYPGYKVGNDGSVWSCYGRGVRGDTGKWTRLAPNIVKGGYLRIRLSRGGKSIAHPIHRLVLLAFVGPCPIGFESRHFPDNNPSANAVGNLSWGTKKENAADRILNGTDPIGERHPSSRLTNEQVLLIRKKAESGVSFRIIAKEFGLALCSVYLIVGRRRWKHI